MALQELATALRERQASSFEGKLGDDRRRLEGSRQDLDGSQRCVASRLPEAAPCAGWSEAAAPPPLFAASLERLEQDLAGVARQTAELRRSLDVEVHSLKRGLAVVADALHAIQPVLDADRQHRMEAESELELLRSEAAELLPLRDLLPLREQRLELSDLLALKMKSRLVALERDAGDCRRKCAVLAENLEEHRSASAASGSGCLSDYEAEVRQLNARLHRVEQDTQARFAAARAAEVSEVTAATTLATAAESAAQELAAAIQGAEAQAAEATAANRAAFVRAMRGLGSEVATERKGRQACEEELSRVVKEQQTLERQTEAAAASRREAESGFGTQVQELSRALRDRLPQEMRSELQAARQEILADIRAKADETLMAARREERGAFARAEEAAEARYGELRERLQLHATHAGRTLDEVRSELHTFMDEQRVFCGFLDTEQRSYQELMRHELATLSKLVDSTLLLRCDEGDAPCIPRTARSDQGGRFEP